MHAAKRLSEYNVNFGFETSIHRKNIDELEEIVNLAISLGAKSIVFSQIKEIGRAKSTLFKNNWRVDYGVLMEVAREVVSLSKKYENRIRVWPLLSPILMAEKIFIYTDKEKIVERLRLDEYFTRCKAGLSYLYVSATGDVYPCFFAAWNPSMNMGNIFIEDLKDIWCKEKWMMFRGGISLDSLKLCRICKYNMSCTLIQCRMLPLAAFNDMYEAHPECYYKIDELLGGRV